MGEREREKKYSRVEREDFTSLQNSYPCLKKQIRICQRSLKSWEKENPGKNVKWNPYFFTAKLPFIELLLLPSTIPFPLLTLSHALFTTVLWGHSFHALLMTGLWLTVVDNTSLMEEEVVEHWLKPKTAACLQSVCSSPLFQHLGACYTLKGDRSTGYFQLEKCFSCCAEMWLLVTNPLCTINIHTHQHLFCPLGPQRTNQLLLPQDLGMVTLFLSMLVLPAIGWTHSSTLLPPTRYFPDSPLPDHFI